MKTDYRKVAAAYCAAAIFLFTACINKKEDIEKVANESVLKPLSTQKNIVYEYSDSSYKRLEIVAPEVFDFSHAEAPYQEFPQGIAVTFYDKLGNRESHIRSNYAKRLITEQLWEARGQVEVENTKGERLQTEQLVWDMTKEIIRSDVFVKIISGDEVIMGEGFEADQNFTSYKLMKNVRGEILIPDQEEDGKNDENR